MPLSWCISFLMVSLLVLMMMMIYFVQMKTFKCECLQKNMDNIMNWKW